MKKGMIVNVWFDPITRNKPEGRAKLLRKLDVYCEPGSEYWTLQFLSDGEVCDRFVTIGDTETLKSA